MASLAFQQQTAHQAPAVPPSILHRLPLRNTTWYQCNAAKQVEALPLQDAKQTIASLVLPVWGPNTHTRCPRRPPLSTNYVRPQEERVQAVGPLPAMLRGKHHRGGCVCPALCHGNVQESVVAMKSTRLRMKGNPMLKRLRLFYEVSKPFTGEGIATEPTKGYHVKSGVSTTLSALQWNCLKVWNVPTPLKTKWTLPFCPTHPTNLKSLKLWSSKLYYNTFFYFYPLHFMHIN